MDGLGVGRRSGSFTCREKGETKMKDVLVNNGSSADEAPQKEKWAIIIEETQDAFGLTKGEISAVCRVKTRKTIYNWLNNDSKPRKSAMLRLFDLHEISQTWNQCGFGLSKLDLFEPIDDGDSVFSLLCSDKLNLKQIMFAGSRLRMQRPYKTLSSTFT